MRALVEWVMRGRAQATAAAMIATVIPMMFWLAASVVALVTLRRGVQEGIVVALWASLPAAVAAWMGEILPLALLLGALMTGGVLRRTASWEWTLCCAALLGLLLSAVFDRFAGAYLAGIEKMAAELVQTLAKQAGSESLIVPPHGAEIAGMFGLSGSVMLVLSLIVARWCQAMLYNPGGFRTEFHALRLSVPQVVGLMAVALAVTALGKSYRLWAWTPLMPLLFAGLGLVHAIAAARGRSRLMGLFYAALLLLPPVKQVVIILAAVDGWMNVRQRWLQPPRG